jgi:hypothetical protein
LLNNICTGSILLLVVFLLTGSVSLFGQSTIRGTVFDMSGKRPMEGVSVLTTSGKGTSTNSLGEYKITVDPNDSIYFSYLNKPTAKFAVSTLSLQNNFDISLHVPSNILPEFRVMAPSYRFDSLQNRKDYAKVFDFKRPGLGITSSPPGSGGAGVGLDLDQLINVFRFRRNRSMLGFQERLILEEQDKYIDHRFNKTIVRKITGLNGEEMDKFMKLFRPSYEFTQWSNEYEFYHYIKKSYLQYKAVFLPANNR